MVLIATLQNNRVIVPFVLKLIFVVLVFVIV